MAFCGSCGAELSSGRFCGKCGAPVGAASSAWAPQPMSTGGASPSWATQPLPTAATQRDTFHLHLQQLVLSGWFIESQSESMAVVVKDGRRVNHVLHFLIGFLTCGLWWFVWLIMVLAQSKGRMVVSIDEAGHIASRKA